MHYHCEIIMPPSPDISKSIEEILKPFDEDTEERSGTEFLDWYVIGGRWAGEKETCRYDAEKMENFYKSLHVAGVTVSGLQAGKQKLEPESQIPMVDELWNSFFPTEDGTIVPCPLFAHSNNQYDSNDLISCDISRFDEIPKELTCARIIFATKIRDEYEATYMLCNSQWNGVNHMPIAWNGSVIGAIEMFLKEIETYRSDYKEQITPKPDWICVTIDYHY